jgi:hypothetical protein
MNAEIRSTSPPDHLAPVFAQYPIEVVHADGVWLHTRDGRKILDLYGGHAVAALGYGAGGKLQFPEQRRADAGPRARGGKTGAFCRWQLRQRVLRELRRRS